MLLHPTDIRLLIEKARTRGSAAVTGLFQGSAGRTQAAWDHTDSYPRQWTSIPVIQERLRTTITGSPATNIAAYIRERYGTQEPTWHALSPGCGTGRKELAWVAAGGIKLLEGYDISTKRIEEAQRLAASANMSGSAQFTVADVRMLKLAPGSFDLVVFDDSLHHISQLRSFLPKVHEWLTPGGIVVVNEFVGPSRFQWTDRQIEVANQLLNTMPARLKVRPDGTPRPPVYRPGTLAMMMYDPSEAVESASILPLLYEIFEVVEEKPCGGALLHLVFKDIAHHFLHPDDEAREVLDHCIATEAEEMANGKIGNDFVFLVARPRSG
jgi:SAM-dependent methyltransferase